MARIAGVNIPNHQHTEIGLTAIFGIGRTRSRSICVAAGVPVSKKVKDLQARKCRSPSRRRWSRLVATCSRCR